MGAYVAWKDYYSVGEESLDAQHMQILGLINELHDAMQMGVEQQAVRQLLDQLVQYTNNHFRHEEELLAANQYPNLAEHKAWHDKMRQKTLTWRDNVTLVTGRDLLVFLKDWWSNHIQNEDKKYAAYWKTPVTT